MVGVLLPPLGEEGIFSVLEVKVGGPVEGTFTMTVDPPTSSSYEESRSVGGVGGGGEGIGPDK